MAPLLMALLAVFLLFISGFIFFNFKAARRKVQRDDEISLLANSRGWHYLIPRNPAAGFQLSGKAYSKFSWQLEVCCGEEGGHSVWSVGAWQSGDRFAAILPASIYNLYAGDEGKVRLRVMNNLSLWQTGESPVLTKILSRGKSIPFGTPDFRRSFKVIASDTALALALFSNKVDTALLNWRISDGDADKIQVFASDKGIQVELDDTADLAQIEKLVSLGLTCLVGLSDLLEPVVLNRLG